jgi:hypothetical protein
MPFYRKKALQEMFAWTPDMPMDIVSVSDADKKNGSPKPGDMIAINIKDTTDFWLVAEEYFKNNYELVSDAKSSEGST